MSISITDIITGERIQELCDIYCGTDVDLQRNPKICLQTQKHCRIDLLKEAFDNPHIVFCYSFTLPIFLTKIQYFTNPFILVSHNEDANIDETYVPLANHSKLIHWFAQNLSFVHPKVSMLPIGVANEMFTHGNLAQLHSAILQNTPKTKDFYFYFEEWTNHRVRTYCRNALEENGFQFGSWLPYKEYLTELASHKFAFCPYGNGYDCHRIWECLYLGVIPIVLRNTFTELLEQQYPCLIVDSWIDLQREQCLSKFEELSIRLHTLSDKLCLSYFRSRIMNTSPLSIVYSYVGTLPEYTLHTVHQARLFFDGTIYFIIDDIQNPIVSVLQDRYNVIVIDYKECIDTEFLSLVESSRLKPFVTGTEGEHSRPFLFVRAFERFFLLRNLMTRHALQNIFFVELDNLLYFDPREYLPYFQTKPLCYMFDNDERCSSGIFFVKNTETFAPLLSCFHMYINEAIDGQNSDHHIELQNDMEQQIQSLHISLPSECLDEWKDAIQTAHLETVFEQHPRLLSHKKTLMECYKLYRSLLHLSSNYILNEMTALYFFHKNNPDHVLLLPTHWNQSSIPSLYSEHFDLFQKTVFDSAPYGIFLYGMDVYHTNGKVQTGMSWQFSFIDATKYTYKMEADSQGRRIPYVSDGSNWFRLNNLHIASKQLLPALSRPYLRL